MNFDRIDIYFFFIMKEKSVNDYKKCELNCVLYNFLKKSVYD